MTTVHTLASGSAGNSLLFSCGQTHILVDAGISCRRITAALKALGLAVQDLSAVLVTHGHKDHVSGLLSLSLGGRFPIMAPAPVCWDLAYNADIEKEQLKEVALMRSFSVGECTITAFPTCHDAPGSCGYRLDSPDGSLGILTDTGYVTEEAQEVLPGVDTVVLEANHDVESVRSGPYPPFLKARILGSDGHLSNADAAAFAVELARHGASEVILAHLSQKNNTPAMAQNTVERALSAAGLSPVLFVAPRSELSQAHIIAHQEALCRE